VRNGEEGRSGELWWQGEREEGIVREEIAHCCCSWSPPRSGDQCLKIRREQKIRRQVNPSRFIKFGKIQRNSEKIDRNAFDERKEQEFFENTKIGRICR
jgi:hypothetical protein